MVFNCSYFMVGVMCAEILFGLRNVKEGEVYIEVLRSQIVSYGFACLFSSHFSMGSILSF